MEPIRSRIGADAKLLSHPEQRDALARGFGLQEEMAIEILAVDQGEVVALAEATRLTVYGASYLWLARRLDTGLVALDRRLAWAMAG